ncbi:SET domain-containing protein 4-like isoform X2 [Limulus polyphemus]|uniref:SET domain-containing protein 4-like isoform X2 n=1 Tax=Limulus polyphemus TaxID=6850 RepID=A0ABM1B3J8_LIMPO|nr:SET domain-containing protein 4-like isoform X2 [Limulus polyphemus]
MCEMGRTLRRRKWLKAQQACINQHKKSYQQLFSWLRSNGFTMITKLKPALFKDTGRGLMACESVSAGQVIVSLPRNLLITSETVKRSYLLPLLQLYNKELTPEETLSIFVMCEKARGQKSPWLQYFDIIPEFYSTPAYFSQEAIKELPYSLQENVQIQICCLQRSYQKLKGLLLQIENFFPEVKGQLTFKDYRWAWFTVNTRCVYLRAACKGENEGSFALAPFLDLLNHSSHVQVKAGMNQENNCYEIVTLTPFSKYSQVFINYGNHDNRRLLLEYGFILPSNPNDIIQFSSEEIKCAFEKYDQLHVTDEKLSFLRERKLLSMGCSQEGMTWNLVAALKLLSVRKHSREFWNMVVYEEVELSQQEQKKVAECARFILVNKLKEYEKKAVPKKKSYENLRESFHVRLAQALCREEQNIILKILKELE